MLVFSSVGVMAGLGLASAAPAPAGQIAIDFGITIRTWDGFGVNYIEGGHTADPEREYEDYGGFSRLSESQRQQVMDLLYGPLHGDPADVGLGLALHKIFLDPHHQAAPDGAFVGPSKSTEMSRYFLLEAAKRLKARGRTLDVLTTYYGVPAWATTTGRFHWRDVAPERYEPLAAYMAKWIVYLRRDLLGAEFANTVRVRAAAVTNEGEFPERWNEDGSPKPATDYNAYWPPAALAKFLPILKAALERHGVGDIKIMPTETAGWDYLGITRGGERIASTLLGDAAARASIGIVGGHSFGPSGAPGAHAVGLFRGALGEHLQAWTTSHDWKTGDLVFAESTRRQLYEVGATGVITWAVTKRVAAWEFYTNRPANRQCAVLVNDDGTMTIQSGFYYYNQATRAGQPGMAVAAVDERRGGGVRAMGFARNGTAHPDAFVLINPGAGEVRLEVALTGTEATVFEGFRTVGDGRREGAAPIGAIPLGAQQTIRYTAPAQSVTTFIARADRD